MATLAWFVEDACSFAGVSPSSWSTLPQVEQIGIIRAWEAHVGTKDDYVKKANFKEIKVEPRNDKPKDLAYEEFSKLDIRVGTVVSAEAVPKSKKLIKMEVSFSDTETRTILAGIAEAYNPETLKDLQVVAVLNLAPRSMMGIESHGMLLAGRNELGQLRLLSPNGIAKGGEIG
jgi:methionyl-tRNA synthetase